MGFWDVLKEVTAEQVRREYETLFRVGIAGDPAAVEAATQALVGDLEGQPRKEAMRFLYPAVMPLEERMEEQLSRCEEVLSLPGGPDITDLRPAHVTPLARPDDAVTSLLALRPERRVAIARRLPGCRKAVADQLIHQVSTVNAQFAAVSNVATVIPPIAWLIPAGAGADLLMLTKNQLLLVFRLGAIYDHEPTLRARWPELAPVVGSALGWRSLARAVASRLPFALGFASKTGMAYAGTYVVGRSAQYYYENGRRPNQEDLKRWGEEARRKVEELLARLPRLGRFKEPLEPPALPESSPAWEGHSPN